MKYLLLFFVLYWIPALAESRDTVAIEFGLGQSQFKRIHRDNYWYQDPFPYQHDLTSAAWRLGVSKRKGNWSYGLAYLDLGAASVKSDAIPSDEAYERCMGGDKSEEGCGFPTSKFRVTDRVRGLEVNATREFDLFYLRGGLLIWHHKLHAINDVGGELRTLEVLPAPFVGVGTSYGPLFVDITYYHVTGDGGYPIAKRAIVPMVGVRVPF